MTTASSQHHLCKLKSMSMVNSLGASHEEIFHHITKSKISGLQNKEGKLKEKTIFLGSITLPLPNVPSNLKEYESRNLQISICCLKPLEKEIEDLQQKHGSDRIAVIIGSSTSGIAQGEYGIAELERTGKHPDGYYYTQQEMGSVALSISKYLKLNGPAYTVSTACSSSAKVFRSAQMLLQSDLCDAVIVGGVDSLCDMTVNGFGALQLLSTDISKPFSKNRNGINIGEAACFFIMTRESGGIQLHGVGESSDAYHFSSPDPEGMGAYRAMKSALEAANLSPSDISYLNLHGTGTFHNDLSEALAVNLLQANNIPCSSTKPHIGHTLGASGASEIGFCWLILEEYSKSSQNELHLPLHLYDGQYDEGMPRVALVEQESYLSGLKKAFCMSNSFGFGGSNCSVIIGLEKN